MLTNRKLLRDKYFLSGWLLILIFLSYSLILAFNSREGIPPSKTGGGFFPYLTDKPLTEDGYYMLTVAWNIAEGKGFTYNYDIRTTGVQPLATLVYSVAGFIVQSFGGTKYDFARAIIIFGSLLQVLFVFLIYKIALSISNNPDKGLYFLISVCVVLLNFKVLLNFMNGLETGLYLLLLSLFFLYWIRIDSVTSYKQVLVLGILSGLLLLCRLDSTVLLFTFYLLLMFNHKIGIRQLVLVVVIALLLYLPWQIYVFDVTGNILQSSARSQTGMFSFFDFQNKVEQFFTSIIQHLTPFLYTGNLLVLLMIPFGLLYIVLFYFIYRKFKLKPVTVSASVILKLMTVSIAVLIVIYFFFSIAPYFYIRYFAIIMIVSFPVFIVISAELYKKFRKSGITALILIGIVFIIHTMLYLHSGKSVNTFSARAGFIKSTFPENVRVAAFQTGISGYYCENIINLDGKMNNDALKSLANGTIESYIDSMHVDVLIEWGDFIPFLFDKEYLDKNWELYSKDIGDGRTVCYVRRKL